MDSKRRNEPELELPRGVTIRTHKKGKQSIQIAFTYKSRQCRETLRNRPVNRKNVRYAADLVASIRSEISDGTFDYLKRFPNSKRARELERRQAPRTMKDLLLSYVEKKREKLAYSSWVAIRSMVTTRLIPGLGERLVGDLSTDQIIAWLESEMDGLSLKYVRNAVTALRQALYQAIHEGVRKDNPAASAVLNVKAHIAKKHWSSGAEADPLTKSEIKQLLDACKEQCVRNLFEVAFETGLRTGELIALRPCDIDLDAAKLTVRRAIVYAYEKDPKTKKGMRTVDLSPRAVAALKNQLEIAGDSGRVFHHPRTLLAFKNSHQVWHLWKAAVELAEIRYRKPYQTRHTYASQMLSRPGGVNLFYLADQMGHTGIEMINRHYGRWIRESGANGAREPAASSWHESLPPA